MPVLEGPFGAIRYEESGPAEGRPLVLAHALGLDLSVWDVLIPLLPPGLRVIRYDLRGHGGSAAPPPPYFMGDHVAEAAALIEGLGARGAVFLGLSIGGVVAMGLASERPDLIGGAILCCTAAKIGTPALWEERAQVAATQGVAALAPAILQRWFPTAFRAARPEIVAHWGARLAAADAAGYAGCCAALAETDLRDALPGLRVPVLAVAGGADGSIPPDLARETAAAIPGAEFAMLPGSGHLPCVDAPDRLAAAIDGFLAALPAWPPGPPPPPRLR